MAHRPNQSSDSSTFDDDERLFVDEVSSFNPSDVKLPSEESLDDADLSDENPNLKLVDAINVSDLVHMRGVNLAFEQSEEKEEDFTFDDQNLDSYFQNDFRLDSEGDNDGDGDDMMSFDEKRKNMTNLTEDGGVMKKLQRRGYEAPGLVQPKATVTVHYCLFKEADDDPFDSTRLRGRPEKFRLDAGTVIPGLEIAIKSMKKTEKSDFLISPDYAFGKLGCGERIPGNATVFARIELLDFVSVDDPESLMLMTPHERNELFDFSAMMKIVAKLHLQGNKYTKQKEWKLAAKSFKQACRLLEDMDLQSDSQEEKNRKSLNKIYLNLGYCYLKLVYPHRACIVLQNSLKIDSGNAKANYRLGVAKRMLGNTSDAKKFLERAYKICPTDDTIGRELASLSKQIEADRQAERALYSRMFGGKDTQSKKPETVSDENYREMAAQLDSFFQNPSETELLLPASLTPDELSAARKIATEMGLKVVETERPKKQIRIVKN